MIPKRSLTKSRKSSTTSTRTLLTAMLWIILVTAANSSSVTKGGSDLATGVWTCNDDVDPDFKLFRMPLPYHATPASSEEDNAPPPPQGYDPALASRLRGGASARRLLSLRKRRPHRFKVRVLSCPMASLTMP